MKIFNKNLTTPSFKVGQSRREFNASLFLMFVFTMTVVFGLFLVKPKIQEDIDLTKQVTELDKQFSILNSKAELLKKLDEGELQQQLNDAVKSLPITRDIPQVIASVETVSRSNGLTPSSIGIDSGKISTESATEANTEILKSLKVQLGLKGSYENFRSFLTKILSSRRLFTLQGFSLKNQENEFEISLNLAYYYQPLLSAQPEISSPVEILNSGEKNTLEEVKNYAYISNPFIASPSSRVNPFLKL